MKNKFITVLALSALFLTGCVYNPYGYYTTVPVQYTTQPVVQQTVPATAPVVVQPTTQPTYVVYTPAPVYAPAPVYVDPYYPYYAPLADLTVGFALGYYSHGHYYYGGHGHGYYGHGDHRH